MRKVADRLNSRSTYRVNGMTAPGLCEFISAKAALNAFVSLTAMSVRP